MLYLKPLFKEKNIIPSRKALSCAIALALTTLSTPSVFAQQNDISHEAKLLTFNIPKQSLANALRILSIQTHNQISVSTALVENLTSNSVIGNFTVDDALSLMLKNTELVIKKISENSYTLAVNAQANSAKSTITKNIKPIEKIIVKGEKIERTLQETASSVAVFTNTQIEEAAIYDIQDVFDRIANVNSARGNESFSIRGINQVNVAAQGSSSLASLHIDGAFISAAGIQGGQKDLWDVSQVEVFRGPQSTNQGRNSLAGAISIRSNDPTYESDGQYRVAYGTDNTRVVSAAYGDALIEDQLAFRISIDDQETDGFINNVTLNDDSFGDSSNTTIRGKLLFEPAAIENLSILTTLSYSKNEVGSIFSSLIDENGNDQDPFSNRVFANIEGFRNVDQNIATIEANYQINENWSVISVSSYNETDSDSRQDDDNQATGGETAINRFSDSDIFTQELRFNLNTKKLKANIGVYYFEEDTRQRIQDLAGRDVASVLQGATGLGLIGNALNGPAGLLTGLQAAGLPVPSATLDQITSIATSVSNLYDDPFLVDINADDEQKIENYAIYANIEYDFNEFFTLFAGARYDNEDVENTTVQNVEFASSLAGNAEALQLTDDTIATLGLTPFSAIPQVSGAVNQFSLGAIAAINANTNLATITPDLDNDTDFSAFLPKIGVTLNWSDDLNTSFTVQRAYRAGGSGSTIGSTFTYEPEFTTNYDFALRSQWFDNRLTANLNIFAIDWEDQQVIVFDNTAGFNRAFIVNAAESSLKGAELELSLRVNSSLDVYTNVGYVDTEFDEFNINNSAINAPNNFGDSLDLSASVDLSGNEFNNAPKITASAGFNYEITSALRLQADINYQDESFDGPSNTDINNSRVLINSKLTYRFNDAFEISMSGRNLFDDEYTTRTDAGNNDVVVVGQPRTVLLQLQGKF